MRGDYGRGAYYRGDPGLFSFVGKALRGVASSVVSHFTGGLVNISTSGKPRASLNLPAVIPQPEQRGLINIGGQGTQTGILNIGGGGGSTNGGPMPATLRGYHLNKATYETRGGGTSRWPAELELHEKHTVLVRNRRMNVGNARALKRSLHRISGFARLARRVMSFTHPRAGRGHFKFKRKKR
jgi:hypothetical protein